jgi:GT2 family glycosyltransferase
MWYVPAALVVHHEGRSTGQAPHRKRAAHYASRLWFYRTHRDRISAGLVRFLSEARACLGIALAWRKLRRDPAARDELDALWRPILATARCERARRAP